MERFDVAVIGGGTAGPSAARGAQARGMSVAVIEEDRFGGDCLWWACVPTKALLECARVFTQTQQAEAFGTLAEHVRLDFARVQARKQAVIDRIAEHDDPKHLVQDGIRVYRAHAAFRSPHELQVGEETIQAEHIVLAVGARARIPPIPGIAQVPYLTNVTAIALPELPASLLILGGGPVGCEFAQMFARFGVKVTLVQSETHLLPREDVDAAAAVEAVLARDGITILTNTKAVQVARHDGQIVLTVQRGGQEQQLVGEQLLIATGREVPLDGLQIEAAGLARTKRGLEVGDTLQTNVEHIWACGDAAGKMLFTHVAENQGQHVGRNLGLAAPAPWDGRVVPRCTFLEPEVASVGLTEAQAAAQYDIVVGQVPFTASDRAIIQDETDGFVKIVAHRADGQVLGGHIVGPRAGDLIHELALAMAARTPVKQVGAMIHLYPALLDPLRWAAQEAEAKRGQPGAEQQAA